MSLLNSALAIGITRLIILLTFLTIVFAIVFGGVKARKFIKIYYKAHVALQEEVNSLKRRITALEPTISVDSESLAERIAVLEKHIELMPKMDVHDAEHS